MLSLLVMEIVVVLVLCEKLVRSRGEYVVRKEQCVGHVQKGMGRSLREYKRKNRGSKLSDGKTVGRSERLTDEVVDKIQNFYGQAIRNNRGDLEGMKNDIWAIYGHTICDECPLEVQHSRCPQRKKELGASIGKMC